MRSLILTSILVAATCAHAQADPALQQLIALDAALQSQAAALASGGDRDSARELLARSEQVVARTRAATRATDGVPEAKLQALYGLRHNLRLAIEHPSEALKATLALPEVRSPLLVLEAGAPGTHCSNPIALEPGTPLRVSMPAGATRWFSVRNDPSFVRELAASTRGSTIDSAVRVWSDCRELGRKPLAEGDDNYGLQAIARLPAATHPLIIELRNLDGDGEAVIDAVTAVAVSGRVVREDTGAPVLGVRVVAYQGTSAQSAGYAGDTYTLQDGTYSLNTFTGGPPQINTYVRTQANFFSTAVLDEAWDDVQCAVGSFGLGECGPGTPTPVATIDGAAVSNIDFALSPGGTLFGQVRDRLGNPVPNAQVSVSIVVGGQVRVISGYSDAHGRYRVAALPNGQARIVASAQGFKSQLYRDIDCASDCSDIPGTSIDIVEFGQHPADFNLTRGGSIRAAVTIAGQSPFLTFVRLAAYNAAGILVLESFGYDNQEFVLGPLPPGSYRLLASGEGAIPEFFDNVVCQLENCQPSELAAATPVVITDNAPAVPISIQLARLPTLTGRITDTSGAPISGARVSLIRSFFGPIETFTGIDGTYALRPGSPGSYLVYAQAPGHLDEVHPDLACENQLDLGLCPGGSLVTFSASSIPAPVDFALFENASVTGRVTFIGNAEAFQIVPLSTANQRLQLGRLSIGSNGNYVLSDLPPQTYRFGMEGGFLRRQLFENILCSLQTGDFSDCPGSGATAVPLVSAQVRTGIDFLARNQYGRTGRVTDEASGMPLQGVVVDLFDPSGNRLSSVVSGADGRFEVVDLFSSGSRYLATDNYLGYVNEVYDGVQCAAGSVYLGTCALTGGTLVAFPGNETEIEFSLARVDLLFASGFE